MRHPLNVGWFFAFWATPTMTVAHLVFAVAEPGTRPERDARGVRYTVRLRAVASDAGGRPSADVDTTMQYLHYAPRAADAALVAAAFAVADATQTLDVGSQATRRS